MDTTKPSAAGKRLSSVAFNSSDSDGGDDSAGRAKVAAKSYAVAGQDSNTGSLKQVVGIIDANTQPMSCSESQPIPSVPVYSAPHIRDLTYSGSNASSSNAQSASSNHEPRKNSSLQVALSANGGGRKLKHYRPNSINSWLHKTIGPYKAIRVLPSGDLLITCNNIKQVATLVNSNLITDGKTNIEISGTAYPARSYRSRAVISGVPLELTNDELIEDLSEYGVRSVKRLTRITSERKKVETMSVLLHFQSDQYPTSVSLGYLYFRTRPYNPPPVRCFKCNRYGHTSDNCRGKKCCSKCGSRDHEYEQCENDKKCVNCLQCHSAAYGGCPAYKDEAKILAIKEKANVSFGKAKELFAEKVVQSENNTMAVPQIARNSTTPSKRRSDYQAAYPALNAGDLRHVKSNHQQSSQSDNRPYCANLPNNIEQIDTVRLLALIAEIVNITISACRSGDHDVYNIVSETSSKYLGMSIEPQALKNVLNTASR